MKALSVSLLCCLLPLGAVAHPVEACACIEAGSGFWSLGNVAMFFGAGVVVVGLLLLYLYLKLPIELLRWLLLVAGAAVVVFGKDEWFAIPSGVWAFFGAVGLGGFVLWATLDLLAKNKLMAFRMTAFVTSIMWGVVAVMYDEPVVGTMAVFAFGFVIASTNAFDLLFSPFMISGTSYTGSTTAAGLLILLLYIVGLRQGIDVSVFKWGALYVSGLVLSTSLLINTWASLNKSWLQYLLHEGMFLGFAVLAVLYGAELDLPNLGKIGGTFLVLWAATKVFNLATKLSEMFHSLLPAVVVLLLIGVCTIYGGSALINGAYALNQYIFLP